MLIRNSIILILVIVAYVINAACDSIDHAKGGRTLMELWHILKALSYGILIAIILYLIEASWYEYFTVWLALWIWWEVSYYMFRALEIWRYDDKFKISWLRKLWKFGL